MIPAVLLIAGGIVIYALCALVAAQWVGQRLKGQSQPVDWRRS